MSEAATGAGAWQGSELVQHFLADRQRLLPLIDVQEDLIERIFKRSGHGVERFVDVGSGDGASSELMLRVFPEAQAVLVDCRTDAEWRFVGVPDLTGLGREVVYVEWNRTDGSRNEGFVDDLVAAGVEPGDRPVVFLCRSGNRSIGAAEAATEAGIAPSYNVLDGFEGNLDNDKHRGGTGWKAVGLPWKQS